MMTELQTETSPLLWTPVEGANYRYDYERIFGEMFAAKKRNNAALFFRHIRHWTLEDLFFLLYGVLRIPVNHPWIIDRIQEVEDRNDRTLDLWAREHFKSTIITFGLTIQEVLRDPEERVGFFSHTQDISQKFLRRIKNTFEKNILIRTAFSDRFAEKPAQWSEDAITLARKSDFQNATIEAHSVLELPTSSHFSIRVYDDIVTEKSVTNADQINKTKQQFQLSHSLGERGGKHRVIGTRYHFADLYAETLEAGTYHARVYPITIDGTPTGEPVLLTRAQVAQQRLDDGPYVFACQKLLSPVADELQEFKQEWVRYYQQLPAEINLYILADPASSKKTDSDYTVIAVVGIDLLSNYYLVYLVRERLNLQERWIALRDTVLRYPTAKLVGYESYGLQADIEHFESRQKAEGVRFRIEPLGGKMAKVERIRRLVPSFSSEKFYLPFVIMQKEINLIQVFVTQELLTFPFAKHDDMLDAISRIFDPTMNARPPVRLPVDQYDRRPRPRRQGSAWAA